MKLTCHICETAFEIPASAKPGDRLTCTNCFAQLGLHKVGGKFYLGCPMCKEEIFTSKACGDCERRREKKTLLEEGKL
jgi:hypothetical protein